MKPDCAKALIAMMSHAVALRGIELPRQGVAEQAVAKQITVRRCKGIEQRGSEEQRLRNDRPGLLWHCTDKRSEGKAVTGIDVPGQGVGVI